MLYMYASLIFLGGATIYTRYKMTNLSFDVGGLTSLLLSFILFFKYKINFKNRSLFGLIVVLLSWSLIQTVRLNRVTIAYSFIWDFILAYIICKVYKKEIFYYFEICTVNLSKIGLILWSISALFPTILPPLLKAISPNWIHGLLESNILIFGLQEAGSEVALFFRRNAGFAWEPGRYASILVVALFINMVRTNFSLIKNRNFQWLALSLISTQSTTGYCAALIIILAYMWNVKRKYFLATAALSFFIILIVFSLPFMHDKIVNLISTGESRDMITKSADYYSATSDKIIVPQRFDGLYFEYLNIIKDPLWGYGIRSEDSYIGKVFHNLIYPTNGLLKVIAQLGLLFGLAYYYLLYKGSAFYSSSNQLYGSAWFILIFLAINVSYPFQFEPLFLAMFLFPYYLSIKL